MIQQIIKYNRLEEVIINFYINILQIYFNQQKQFLSSSKLPHKILHIDLHKVKCLFNIQKAKCNISQQLNIKLNQLKIALFLSLQKALNSENVKMNIQKVTIKLVIEQNRNTRTYKYALRIHLKYNILNYLYIFFVLFFVYNCFLFIHLFIFVFKHIHFLQYLKSFNKIGDKGASGLGSGLAKCINLSNLTLHLGQKQFICFGL
ncbi:transmembrane protein, putative (macronuclear) [Tetrahymena thermophila SB210]|uniref:Transmembrane protein, putative n=1 Tax=Tetrahymena thermophila (strain SB210) TaxID=312017 RepID=W7XIY2_TETTS|nr:transmembrane protein, putative [Tetrahymena thermophila SB210]EWS75031.1 transmembrane protein, putative [Tetrahymena thermophila SB210]|eukprot:XP_012652430.1 transmembrane protein, putative [Tetrahymena thermophila SB210]